MKKVIISLCSMGAAIVAALIVVLCVVNRKTQLKLDSYDGQSHLDLGKYKVSDYKESAMDGCNEYITFNVKSQNDFYNEIIKASDLYDAELEFDVDGYFSFGFLSDNGHTYQYTIKDNFVRIIENSGDYTDDSKASSFDDYHTLDSYYINLPIATPLYYKKLDKNSSKYTSGELDDWSYSYYSSLEDKNITYEMITAIVKRMDKSLYKIEDDFFAVKGVKKYTADKERELSSDYLLKFTEVDGKVLVENYD